MASANHIFLRQHIEAVWNVRLPVIEQDEVTLLPSASPPWKLYAAELAAGRVHIWRPGIERAERETLLTRLKEALLLPASSTPPPGISREVAFQLAAEPVIDPATARQLARPLTSQARPRTTFSRSIARLLAWLLMGVYSAWLIARAALPRLANWG